MKFCWYSFVLTMAILLLSCSAKENKFSAELTFREIPCSSPPPARLDASLAEDLDNKRIFLFGGRGEGGVFFSDLWIFQIEKNSWEKVRVEETPPARSGASLVWHPEKRTLFLFGGFSSDKFGRTRYLADLWLWNEQEGWRQEPFEIGPSGRAWASAAVWNDKVIIYGGFGKKELPEPLGDLWALDTSRLEFEILSQEKSPPLKSVLLAGEHPVLFGYRQKNGEHVLERKFLDSEGEIIYKTSRLDDVIALPHPELGVAYFIAYYTINEDIDLEVFLASSEGTVKKFKLEKFPPTLSGLACAAAEAGTPRFICFGGARRDKLSSTTWSFEHVK